MSQVRIDEQCQEAMRQMDALVDNSLPPDLAGGVLAHLGICSLCAEEFQQRKMLRNRLQSAARNVAAPAFLEARVRANLRNQRRGVAWKFSLAGVAAAVAICVAGGTAYQFGHLRMTVTSRESYIASVSTQVANVMRIGLGDHIHCSVYRKYPSNPPTMDEFVKNLGPDYSGVIPIVRGSVPEEYQLVLAHRCRYHGRPFIHLALKNNSQLLSVVIADKGEGESFAADDLVPALQEAGIPVYQAGVQRFQLAAFESSRHLVYVISDFSQQKNMDMMRAMAPALKTFFAKLES